VRPSMATRRGSGHRRITRGRRAPALLEAGELMRFTHVHTEAKSQHGHAVWRRREAGYDGYTSGRAAAWSA
jgi:hypothetical protein